MTEYFSQVEQWFAELFQILVNDLPAQYVAHLNDDFIYFDECGVALFDLICVIEQDEIRIGPDAFGLIHNMALAMKKGDDPYERDEYARYFGSYDDYLALKEHDL